MKQDEIIEMAIQVGLFEMTKDGYEVFYPDNLETFAKLVAAKEREACFDAAMKAAEAGIDTAIALEREACLKICEQQASTNYWEGADVCADAIRARGEA